MRELEMMDWGDLENMLDMKEALRYYSRLSSSFYLRLVNKFFRGTSISFNSSKRGSTLPVYRPTNR
ncbi:hypothetical protein CDL15_Pgr018541 [Punica granatum]|uniref:Uncharacterized protein n=1 Tax=Punica granatum TaxID=22663 RepID=A0A218X0V9_PUNGR|nr:hypothetical protein CDL15_Pgr018541 [Punica granatum]